MGNLGFRWIYAFVPTVAGGLGVSLATMGVALSARDATGLTAPAVGRAADRGRLRLMMTLGLAGTGIGSLVAGGSTGIAAFAVGLTVLAAGKIAFDASMTTWLSSAVPFGIRGRITGLTELSWATSFLVGVPLLALLIDAGDWRWAFYAMAAANLAMIPAVLGSFREPTRVTRTEPGRFRPTRPVVLFLVGVCGYWVAMQAVLVTFATWLSDDFDLDVSGLGLTAIALGFAELVGTGATVLLTDRLGKRRAIQAGAAAMIVPVALLPFAGNLTVAIVLLAGTVLGFEFAVISSLPLLGELDPAARGRLIGVGIASFTAARAATSVPAAWLYTTSGIGGVAILACAALVIAVVALGGVREPEGTP